MLLAFAWTASAQETTSPTERNEWLTEFSEINISGPFNITFEQVAETEAPRIVYDTKGAYTSKFRAEVKNKVLTVSEKAEDRRTTITEVKLFCHALTKIRISGATATFQTPLTGTTLDVVIGGGAVVTAPIEVVDLMMDVSGKSRVILTGASRYFTLSVSTAKIDASQFKVMSLTVDASNKAEASFNVTERMEAKAATGGRISYTGTPIVMHSSVGFTGGEVVKID